MKHVMAAVLEGVAGGPDADLAATYVRWMAQRQIAGGAAYLDLNVDEVSHDVDGRLAAMVWLVGVVGPVTTVPLSIDSSDCDGDGGRSRPRSSRAGPAARRRCSTRPPPTASRSLTWPPATGSPVVLSSTGATMPTGTEERMVRAIEMIEMAQGHGLSLGDLHVDPLVIPIGVDAEAGTAYLDAVRQLRDRFGPGAAHHERRLQRVLRDAGPPAHQRRVPGPVRAGRARTAASSTRSPRTSPRLAPGPRRRGLPAGGRPADRRRRLRGGVHRGVPGRAAGPGDAAPQGTPASSAA